ncbi:helicase-related protein [Patulibacter brassicae]|uniref:Helicase-related protein n=1 Tax=Patulibacter brassicae TaxID=1705717 RepID=A0ABU4VKT1_9ACTN|nr:helicase-related protein [Patulibacter brassicae]MDX8152085.1 helicase-related protein [Patulibacter brassicae]
MLVGPSDGQLEEVLGMPNKRYLMGILFPVGTSTAEVLAEEQEDVTGASEGDLTAEDPVALAGQWLPSSMGLSLFVDGEADEVSVDVWGARYDLEATKPRRRYVRRPLADEETPDVCPLSPEKSSYDVLGGAAKLRVRRRDLPGGTLLTCSLVNNEVMEEDAEPEPEHCLYQVGLRVRAGAGRVLEYPSVQLLSRDEEEQELRLMYRASRTFAIGHGCAVTWKGADEDRKDVVTSRLLPRHEVRGVTQSAPPGLDRSVLRVARLADHAVPWPELRSELEAFVNAYGTWAKGERDRDDIPGELEPARERIVGRIGVALDRMRAGLEALDDEIVRRSFRLANEAMALQRLRQGKDFGGTRRRRDEDVDMTDDISSSEFFWHPFQLAFQLLTLPSLADPSDAHREDVDLIWFPTGGGKTEAYLAVAVTEIFLRRLRAGARGGGTAILTRYTLRLLTAQQFERAAATICACDVLRRRHPALGDEPISIGLWVGDEATPNKCSKAVEIFSGIRQDDRPVNPFQLEQCPYCGTQIIPETLSEDDDDYGIVPTLDDFRIHCPTSSCPFYERLPIQVVDEVLYRRPPTLLLGTVDKFAQLAWNAAGLAFFGGDEHDAPSLIIQDELHLLSGPLGTTVGVYEAAIEALCARHGVPPKIVASTATIRRSQDQVRELFGGRQVRLFPPSGVDSTNSFFARRDEKSPGRLYAGVMAQSHTLSTAMVHLAAALLQGVAETEMSDAERDAYWTLVVYHNSLRELGRTVTLARDDVPARLKGIGADGKSRELGDDDVVELTSNVGGKNLTSILERMKRPVTSDDVISVLACTNMLSVGVDVGRLGLMVVNGQPKTTSEYIQATSRVGRGEVPGLVFSLFTATKPRDRSHYESFEPYHAAFYRRVEPTSVTPWSPPSRDRALHAAFVILVRAFADLLKDEDAHAFDPASTAVDEARQVLLDKIGAADPEELASADQSIGRLIERWVELKQEAEDRDKRLRFRPGGKAVRSLLRNFGERGDGWETLQSMRNVDRQVLVKVQGEDA